MYMCCCSSSTQIFPLQVQSSKSCTRKTECYFQTEYSNHVFIYILCYFSLWYFSSWMYSDFFDNCFHEIYSSEFSFTSFDAPCSFPIFPKFGFCDMLSEYINKYRSHKTRIANSQLPYDQYPATAKKLKGTPPTKLQPQNN